jgi:hypothetical protein
VSNGPDSDADYSMGAIVKCYLRHTSALKRLKIHAKLIDKP